MSGTIWPVDAVSGAPSYTGRMLREAAMTALAGGATAARPFGGFSGVRPGTSKTIGTMSGLNYTITPFGGAADPEASALAGMYGFAFPANETGTINAQTGTARTDLLSVKFNDPAEGDAGLPSVSIVYTVGVPGLPPSPGHGFDLYQINVPATGGGSPTLTWIAPVLTAAGGRRIFETVTQMQAQTIGIQTGALADVTNDPTTANNLSYRWNGSAWKAWESDWITYTPSLGQATGTFAIGTGGSAKATLKYRYESGLVHVKDILILGTTGTMGTTVTISLPVNSIVPVTPYRALSQLVTINDTSAIAGSTVAFFGAIVANNVSQSTVIIRASSGTANITPSVPMTWAAGDSIEVDFFFEPA